MADMKLFNMRVKDGVEVRDGPTLHLSHEHLRALKRDTPLSHGAGVEIHGFGHVSDVSSHEDMGQHYTSQTHQQETKFRGGS